jgi:UDP-glucuronate 4-epimerase
MSVLVTGAAGFIGFHVSKALLARGEQVVGIDNLSPYYDVTLKQARLDILRGTDGFSFETIDIADNDPFGSAAASIAGVDRIVHLAAQAGVRHSLTHPHDYVRANIVGHLNILEFARAQSSLKHLVYASSSSVYGTNRNLPFSVDDRTDAPVSLYGATKKADELMSHSYSYLYKIPQTGLRFFTVYGPWGRPDMALFLFTKAILDGDPIKVFNFGEMMRDFTYIDDIVSGTIGALDHPASDQETGVPHAVYNLGNHRSEPLMRMIELLEDCLGKKAEKIMEPIQPGDVAETFADIEPARRDLGFDPKTSIEVGIPAFVDWYRDYFGIA